MRQNKKIVVTVLALMLCLGLAATALATKYTYSVVLPRLSGSLTLVTGTKSVSTAKHQVTDMGGDYDAMKVWVEANVGGTWTQVTDKYISYTNGQEVTIYYTSTVANGTSVRGRGNNETFSTVTVTADGYFIL